MKIQIPVKIDNKHRVTIPTQIYRKLAPHDEVLVEYDMGQPNVVHIVIMKKTKEKK
jgi:bifunctional DNA-binding transcriptional regulator/antitoxin component of YhaV-PrlF toxin-antitoxin module